MRIGLTYDMKNDYLALGYSEETIAEFDSEETIAALEGTLRELGHIPIRIGHIRALVSRLAQGETWDLVFNIAEGLAGRSRESQIPALLEAYNLPYTFSDPLTLAATLDKAIAKRLVQAVGVRTPEFFAVASLAEAELQAKRDLAYPLFVKPNCEGTGKGVDPLSIVRNREQLLRQCQNLLMRFQQPVLVETFLPGREYTVGIVGTGEQARSIGVLEVKLLNTAEPEVYSYLNKEQCESRVKYSLVQEPAILREASELAVASYRALECRDAGRVDLRTDEQGNIHFLEVNPLAGLHPTHSDLPIICTLAGVSFRDLISEIVASASVRISRHPAVDSKQR